MQWNIIFNELKKEDRNKWRALIKLEQDQENREKSKKRQEKNITNEHTLEKPDGMESKEINREEEKPKQVIFKEIWKNKEISRKVSNPYIFNM